MEQKEFVTELAVLISNKSLVVKKNTFDFFFSVGWQKVATRLKLLFESNIYLTGAKMQVVILAYPPPQYTHTQTCENPNWHLSTAFFLIGLNLEKR